MGCSNAVVEGGRGEVGGFSVDVQRMTYRDAQFESERELIRQGRTQTRCAWRHEVVSCSRGDVSELPVKTSNAVCNENALGGVFAKGNSNILALETKF